MPTRAAVIAYLTVLAGATAVAAEPDLRWPFFAVVAFAGAFELFALVMYVAFNPDVRARRQLARQKRQKAALARVVNRSEATLLPSGFSLADRQMATNP